MFVKRIDTTCALLSRRIGVISSLKKYKCVFKNAYIAETLSRRYLVLQIGVRFSKSSFDLHNNTALIADNVLEKSIGHINKNHFAINHILTCVGFSTEDTVIVFLKFPISSPPRHNCHLLWSQQHFGILPNV